MKLTFRALAVLQTEGLVLKDGMIPCNLASNKLITLQFSPQKENEPDARVCNYGALDIEANESVTEGWFLGST